MRAASNGLIEQLALCGPIVVARHASEGQPEGRAGPRATGCDETVEGGGQLVCRAGGLEAAEMLGPHHSLGKASEGAGAGGCMRKCRLVPAEGVSVCALVACILALRVHAWAR